MAALTLVQIREGLFALCVVVKVFTIQNQGVITMKGVKSSKNRSVGLESVHNDRVITMEGCSLREVLLYSRRY